MTALTGIGRIVRSLRIEGSAGRGAPRFPLSPKTSGPPPWALQARRVPLPKPDRGFRKPAPTSTERRARLPVCGAFIFGGMQS